MEEAPYVPAVYPPLCKEPARDIGLAELAARQHAVVAMTQLRWLGLSGRAVRDRVASGRLHRVHRGVYSVGHRLLSERGRWMAAVLACGPKAVLSHRSAAALWGLRPDARATSEVSLPSKSARPRAGIDVHVSSTLRPEDLAVRERIPCTSVARTLVDLGDVVGRREVERAVEQAEVLRSFDLRAIEDALGRAGPRRGAGVLRAVIGEWAGNTATASELEERFLTLCSNAALPQPEVNAWLTLDDGAIKADFLWRAARLVAETDGRAAHATTHAFERDRLRDQRLALADYRVLRFTWRQVTRQPKLVAATVGALLGR
jgi:putative AbiEi antitoxin of type IV toxin-antitoxin system/uncharacterized protein DUF559